MAGPKEMITIDSNGYKANGQPASSTSLPPQFTASGTITGINGGTLKGEIFPLNSDTAILTVSGTVASPWLLSFDLTGKGAGSVTYLLKATYTDANTAVNFDGKDITVNYPSSPGPG